MNSMDYNKVLPPHSYLNADDYVDPKELMKKLEEISKDAAEYESYFWWKRHYIVKKSPTYRNVPCQLCDILNNPKYVLHLQHKSLRKLKTKDIVVLIESWKKRHRIKWQKMD